MVDCISSIGKKWVKRAHAVLVFVLLVLSTCAGCIHQEEESEPAPVLEDYFRGDFVVTGEPILNQEVEILFTVKPITDSPNTEIFFYLPEGIELVQGNKHWTGDIKEDEVVEIKISVRPILEGQWEIYAYVKGMLDGKYEKDRDYSLFFLISKDSGQVSRIRFYPPSVEQMGKSMTVGLVIRVPQFPKVDEEVVVTFTLIASRDVPNVRAVIVLPEELILIDGVLEWTGNLEKEKEETFQITIRTTESGRFEILGILTYDDEEWKFANYVFVD
jgi:hypothetical protein